jgi:glyoxylase I family protein
MTPPLTGFHHFSPTVRDVEKSVEWYTRVLGLQRLPGEFPHWGNEQTGHAVVMMNPETGVIIGVHRHEANGGETAHESRTGLDHMAFGVAEHSDLGTWTSWLDEQGVEHSGVIDVTDPMTFSTVVFRDPDNVQLELCWFPPA